MFASLLLMTAPLLNLDVGQAYQIVAQMDCETGIEEVDFNGAASTSSMGSGKKQVTLFFSAKWPWTPTSDIGVLAMETQGKRVTLQELTYKMGYVPEVSDRPQLSFHLSQGDTNFYMLTSRDGSKKGLWDFEQSQLLVHGATLTYKGVCQLKAQSE